MWADLDKEKNPDSVKVQGLLAEVIRRDPELGNRILDEGQWGLISELERGGEQLVWAGSRPWLRYPSVARGVVAELRSGQGKTLALAVHVFQKSLTGHVDVRFSTDRLAKRDFDEAYQKIEKWLGMRDGVGLVREHGDPDYNEADQRAGYRKRITLGSDNTFKFDFLRDEKSPDSEPFQASHEHLVSDEVDQIKVDRGATPHVLADSERETPQGNEDRSRAYNTATKAAEKLQNKDHYDINKRTGLPMLTRAGRELVEKLAPTLSEELIAQAIRAKGYIRDWHYRVVGDQIVITDYRFSGYPLRGQRYRDGVHEAIAAKEGLPIGSPQRTSAQTTEARFAGLYESESGVTGTVEGPKAKDDMRSFVAYYRLRVARVYTSMKGPGVEKLPPLIYLTEQAKLAAKAEESAAFREDGLAVLTVSPSDLEAETLAAIRRQNHQAESKRLTADPNDLADEENIIRWAGQAGSLLDATLVASRGTDINSDYLVVLRDRSYTARADQQSDARAGRRDRPGATRWYGSLESPFLYEHADPIEHQRLRAKYRGLVEEGRLDPMSEINDKELIDLFDQAQRNSERANFKQLGITIRHPERSESVVADTALSDRGRAGGPADQAQATPRQTEPGQPIEFSEAADRVHLAGAEVTTTREGFKNAQNTLRDDANPANRDQNLRELDKAAQAYSDARQRLSQALDDYRKLLNKAPPDAPTGTAIAIPTTPVLAARPEDAQQAETQARDRDYQAAIDTLQRLAAAAALVQTYSDQDWGAAGWTVTTARQAISTLQRLAILENQGARSGETEAADRELAILFARLNSLVRTGAKDDLLASTEANRAAAEITRQLRGLAPTSETEMRGQALAAYQGRAKLWRLVRDRLRLIEQGLSPAERARWDRSDRIEELIARIHDRATRDGRHRDSVYQALVAAGITSISQLAAMDDTALAEVGLKPSSIKAIRAALSRTAVEAALNGRALPDRASYRQAVLLATAMRTGPTTAQLHQALRTVLPEVLDAKVAAGKLTAEQAHSLLQAADIWPELLLDSTDVARTVDTMAGMPAEMTGLFDRAGTADGLSRAERDTLIAYAAGALRHTQPGTDGGLAAQLAALAVLNNHIAARDRTRAGAGNTSSDTPGGGDNTPSTPQPATANTPEATSRGRRLRRAGVAAAVSALLTAVGGFGGGFAALGWGAVPAVLAGAAVAAVTTGVAGRIWRIARARGPPFLAPLVFTSWALIDGVTMSGGSPAAAALTVAGAVLGASAVRARLERGIHRGNPGRRGLRTVGRVAATLALGAVLFAGSSWLPLSMANPVPRAGQATSVSITAVEQPTTPARLAATISAAPDGGRQRPAEVPILRGDTFDELARALGVSSDELAAANPGLKNRNLIIAGETLWIPPSWDGTWRLDRTLWDTARRFGVPGGWRTLVAWNPGQLAGRDATKLPSGLRITVVNPSPPETQKPPGPATPKQAPPKEAPPKAAPADHAQANQGIAWGNVLLDVLKVIVGGNLAVRGLDRLGKRLDRVRDRRVADRAWVALERIAAGLGADQAGAALDDLVAAERAVRELLASPDATPDAVAAAEHAREAAHQAVAELVGDALVDAVRLGVSDRRLARALRRPVGVAALLAGPTRDVLGAPTGTRPGRRGAEADAVERAWEKVVARRDAVRQADQRLKDLVVNGVRWVLSPRDDAAVLPRDALDRVASVLGLPRELVESIAIGLTGVDDPPASVWTNPILRIRRFEAFEGRLGSLRRALDDELRKRGFAVAAVGEATDVWRARLELHRAVSPGSTSAAGGGPGVFGGAGGSGAADLAGRAPLPAPGALALHAITKVAGGLRWLRANRPRGPPELEIRWRGEIRQLRQLVDQHRPQWEAATKAERGELTANDAARAAVVQQAGGMVGLLRNGVPPDADLTTLGESNRRATTASAHDTDARLAFIEAVRPAVRHAASQGLPLRRIVSVTKLDWETVSEITREARPDPGQRAAWVDPVRELWIGFWGWRHRAEETLTMPNGERVSTEELVTRIKRIDGDAGDQLALLVDGKVAGLIGTERMVVYDLSDGHFHHIGYDDPRTANIEDFLTRLKKAGHQGVITFHPIPQRGIGLTTAGGALYYLVTNVVTMGLLFNKPMLHMWGKFPDVRLLDAVRKLPPELRGRAVLGVVGARMDMPGALGYLRLMAILNPDLAHLVGETTIAKEAVTDLLGDQAIRTINPEWSGLVGKLVTAIEALRDAHESGKLTAERLAALPDELSTLITGQEPVDPEKLGTGLVEALVTSVKPIADLMGDIRQPRAANELRAAAKRIDQGLLPAYNPNLRELLRASAEIGYLVVLHNDFGLARLGGNGRFVDTTPDERFGAPLLALLAQYPKAKIVLAHLGVGKFTTLNVEHLELIDQVLSDRRFDHISFDISWNEVTRHLLADKAITDKFIELVVKHPDRFIFGSDAVKPESNAQYFRQHHDLDPIWKRIRDEVGQDAYDNIRWRTLETRLLEAQQDVQQWVYNEMRSPFSRRQWRQVLAHVMPHRRDVLDNWLAEQDEAGRELTDHGRGPDYTTLLRNADGTMSRRELSWRENVQLRSLLRWHNVVTPAVVAGARPLRVLLNSIRAGLADRRQDTRQRKQARRTAERSVLDQASDTEGLDLRDPDGNPYTVEALIAAYHTGKALNPDGTDQTTAPDQARHVLRLTQESELRRIADQAGRDNTRKRLTRSTLVSAAVMIGIVGFLGWQWAPLIAVFFPTVNYVAFAARGGLNVHRTLYTHQMRVLVESILERGQFDLHTIRRLAKTMRKYAVFDRATPEQIARLDRAINKILVIAHVLENLPLQPGQTAGSRHDTALQLFSMFLDEAGNALGAQAQSFHGLNAHGGLLGRLVNTALAMTLVTNLVGHVLGAVTGVGGYDVVQNGFFAAADLLFLVPAGVSAVTGLAGWDAAAHPLLRRLNHWGLRVITVANGLLTYQLGWLHPSPLVFSAAGLTLASGYLAWLSVIAELRAGRLAPRRGATANGVLNASLLSFGLITLLPQHWNPLAVSIGAAAVTMWGAAQLDNGYVNRWLARRGFPLPTRLPTTAEVAQKLEVRRAELAERLGRLRQRFDQTSRLRWDATRIAAGNALVSELGRAHATLMKLDLASPRAAAEVTELAEHIDSLRSRLDALLASAPAHGPPATAAPETSDGGRLARTWQAVKRLFGRHPRAGVWVLIATGIALAWAATHGWSFIPGGGGVTLSALLVWRPRLLAGGRSIRGPPPAGLPHRGPGGGAALLSRGDVGGYQRTRTEHLIARLPVAEELLAGGAELAVLSGVAGRGFASAGGHGLRAVDGLIAGTQGVGVQGGLVMWASADGWIYADTHVLAALRAGVLDPTARRALFDHELAHLRAPHLPESRIRRTAPLPDLTPLAFLYGESAARAVPAFHQVSDEHGAPAWQAPELGDVPPAALSRVVRVVVDDDLYVGSGLLWSADGHTGYVLTNRHVIEFAERVRVEVSTPAGVRRVRGRVAARAPPAPIAAWLDASGAIPGATAGELEHAAAQLDLAIVRIPEARRLAPLELDHEGGEHRVALLGFPARNLPVRTDQATVRNLVADNEYLVISAGVAVAPPGPVEALVREFDLYVAGGQWSGPGSSGGPLVTRTATGRGGIVERVAGIYEAVSYEWPGLRLDSAVGAAAVEAFLRAHGLRVAPGPRGAGAAIRGGFLPGEEGPLREALREALAGGLVRPVNPSRLPATPRGPPVSVVSVPGVFLRARGLGRVADHLGAYTLSTENGPVIFFTEEMFGRLRAAGLLAEVLWIETNDRVLGLRDEMPHQRHVDAVMGRLMVLDEISVFIDELVSLGLPLGERFTAEMSVWRDRLPDRTYWSSSPPSLTPAIAWFNESRATLSFSATFAERVEPFARRIHDAFREAGIWVPIDLARELGQRYVIDHELVHAIAQWAFRRVTGRKLATETLRAGLSGPLVRWRWAARDLEHERLAETIALEILIKRLATYAPESRLRAVLTQIVATMRPPGYNKPHSPRVLEAIFRHASRVLDQPHLPGVSPDHTGRPSARWLGSAGVVGAVGAFGAAGLTGAGAVVLGAGGALALGAWGAFAVTRSVLADKAAGPRRERGPPWRGVLQLAGALGAGVVAGAALWIAWHTGVGPSWGWGADAAGAGLFAWPGRRLGRMRARQAAVDGWDRVSPAGPGAGAGARLDMWRLLTWMSRTTDGPVTLIKFYRLVKRGAPGAEAWAQDVARYLAAHKTIAGLKAEMIELGRHGLWDGGLGRPGGVLGALLARAPPGAVKALVRNPSGAVGVALGGLDTAEQAREIRGWLRDTVLAWGEVERGWRAWVPLWLRGPDTRAAAERLRGPLAQARDAVRDAVAELNIAVDKAKDQAAADGLGARRIEEILDRLARFGWYRLGQGVSAMGSAASGLMLIPLIAVEALHASPWEASVLTLVRVVAELAAALPVGAVLQRMLPRVALTNIELARAVVGASVVVAAPLGVLTLGQLWAVTGLLGVLDVASGPATNSFLPSLASGEEQLQRFTRKLNTTLSAAEAVGPLIAAGLVAVIGLPSTVVLDVLTSVFNVVVLWSLFRGIVEHKPGRAPDEKGEQSGNADGTGKPKKFGSTILGGLGKALRHPVLKRTTALLFAHNMLNTALNTILVAHLVGSLHASPSAMGSILMVAVFGGVLGSWLGQVRARSVGSARLARQAHFWTAPLYLGLALAQPGWGLILFGVGMAAFPLGSRKTQQATSSYLNSHRIPEHERVPILSARRFLTSFGQPLGAILAGVFVNWFGTGPVVWFVSSAMAAASLWFAFSLRNFRDGKNRPVENLEDIPDARGPMRDLVDKQWRVPARAGQRVLDSMAASASVVVGAFGVAAWALRGGRTTRAPPGDSTPRSPAAFATIDEIDDGLRAIHARHPGISSLREIGLSRAGHPLLMLTVYGGGRDALVMAGPHPNEPIGNATVLTMAERVARRRALRTDWTWHFLASMDPDGARLNEGWYGGPLTLRHYHRHFYRPPGYEQPEWMFPHQTERSSSQRPLPETEAIMEVIHAVRPELVYSLHNMDFGDPLAYTTRPLPGLAADLRALAARHGFTLATAHIEAVGAVEAEPGQPGVWLWASADDQLDATGGRAGINSGRYAERFGGFGFTVELPWLTSAPPEPHARRPVSPAPRETLERVLETVRPLLPHSPLLAPVDSNLKFIKANEVARDNINNAPAAERAARHDELLALHDWIYFYSPLRAAGMLIRLLAAEVAKGNPAPELTAGLAEVQALFERTSRGFDRLHPHAEPIPINTLVELQMGAAFAAANRIQAETQ